MIKVPLASGKFIFRKNTLAFLGRFAMSVLNRGGLQNRKTGREHESRPQSRRGADAKTPKNERQKETYRSQELFLGQLLGRELF